MFYTGRVTDAATGLPLSGIRVSDGKNVTFTDSAGRYALAGWQRAYVLHTGLLTAERDDWFAYTGGKAGVYDFAVTPVKSAGDFCFFHVSDTEINGRKQLDWVDFIAAQAKLHAPVFLINTGDLFSVEGLNRHAAECSRELVGCPVRYTIGNHDFADGDYGEQLFEQLFGPTWCSFDCGSIHFVCLSIGKGDKPSGYEPQDQFNWLKNDLAAMAPGQKLVVLDHDCCADEETFVHTVQDAEMDIGSHGLIAWICGHFHTAYDLDRNGVRIMCSGNPGEGGIDSSAAGVRKISVTGGRISSEFLYNQRPTLPASGSLWRTKLPGHCEFSQSVLHEGDLFICTCEYGYSTGMGIYRICDETGQIKWFFNTQTGIKGGMDIQGGRVYLQDCGGTLYCLNAADGQLLWQVSQPLNATAYTRMNVLVREGVVLAGRPRQLFAYDAATGTLLWAYRHKRGGDTPARLIWDEKRKQVIFCALWYMTAALDITTGAFIWQNAEHPANLRNNTPLICGDTLYGCGQNWVYRHDLGTGALLKKAQKDFYADSPGSPVTDGGLIYYSTSNRGVVALDKETFETVRVYPAGPTALLTAPYIYGDAQTVEGSPILDGDRLIFAASDGILRVYDKHSAALLKSVSIGAPCVCTPVLSGNCIYIADFNGFVTKFEL